MEEELVALSKILCTDLHTDLNKLTEELPRIVHKYRQDIWINELLHLEFTKHTNCLRIYFYGKPRILDKYFITYSVIAEKNCVEISLEFNSIYYLLYHLFITDKYIEANFILIMR